MTMFCSLLSWLLDYSMCVYTASFRPTQPMEEFIICILYHIHYVLCLITTSFTSNQTGKYNEMLYIILSVSDTNPLGQILGTYCMNVLGETK